MIGIAFTRTDEVVEIRIDNNNINWRSSVYGAMFFPLDTLDLQHAKVLQEFPDLKEVKNWKDIAMQRLKDKLKSLWLEKEKVNYIVAELSKVGYTPHSYQKQGGRTKRWALWTQELSL